MIKDFLYVKWFLLTYRLRSKTARNYAIKCHSERNQMYGKHPYFFHLRMVANSAKKFIHLIPEEDRSDVINGCWVHDVIEDTGVTLNDVKKATNEVVAEYAFALTTEKGRNRKERANAKYYEGIKAYKHATFIKLCDRYSNIKYSKETGSSMFHKYLSEMADFKKHLYDGRYTELWYELENLKN